MATIIVNSLADTIANDGFTTLREAIQAANTDAVAGDTPAGSGTDTIIFAAALSGQTIHVAGGLQLTSALNIDGDFNDDGIGITVASDSTASVFTLTSSAVVTIDGLTVTGGGGSILHGGGILNNGGDLTVRNSVLFGNRAAQYGGAIASFDGNLTIVGTTISGNYAYLRGGGILFRDTGGSTLEISNSTISGNTGFMSGGGGLYVQTTSTGSSLTNVTITANYSREGSGIYASGPLTIQSSTIAGNIGEINGIAATGIKSSGPGTTLINTVVAANFGGGPDLDGSFISGGNNFIGDGGLGIFTDGVKGDQVGTSGTPIDPLLGPLANNGGVVKTMAPTAGSPLVDAGRNGALPLDVNDIDGDGNTTERLPLDATGRIRVDNGVTDIGAFEVSSNDAPTIRIQGNLDVVVANVTSDDFSVLLGNGLGGLGTATIYLSGQQPVKIALGDLDGDGILDAVTGNTTDHNMMVRLGDGLGGFGPATLIASGDFGNDPYLVDLNGDGKLDYIVADQSANRIAVMLGDGLGGFGPSVRYNAGPSAFGLTLGDLNGDGKIDAVVTNSYLPTPSVSVLLGNGDGTFQAKTTIPAGIPTIGRPVRTALGDVDGDGQLDIVLTRSDSLVSVMLGQGDGTFGAETAFAIPADPSGIALGDFDGDGDLDAVIAHVNTNLVSVVLGDGAGNFGAAETYAVGALPQVVTLGDMNNDGNLDIVVANSASNTMRVLLGDGAGDFTVQAPVSVGTGVMPRGHTLGDVDNARVTAEETAIVFNAAHGNKITLGDVDSGGGDETLTLSVAHGTLTLATIAGLTSVGANGTSTVTLTGSIAELNAAIDGLIYVPDEDYTGKDKLSLALDDGGNSGAGGSKTAAGVVPIIVTAVNDAPEITAPLSIAATEDHSVTLTGISFSDIDAGSGAVSVSLSVAPGQGTLAATSGSGVTVSGSGSIAISLVGSITDINAFIAASKLTYAPAANANGNVTLGITISDGGNTGGPANVTTGQTIIAIASVNDAPSGTNKTVSTTEDTPFVFTVADFGFSDTDGNSLKAVKIATLPAGGVLKLDGVALAAGATVDAALIAAGKLTYLPAANANGAPLAGFTFKVQDNGGGSDTDPTANSMTINVSAVNDPPTLTASQVLTSLKETADTSGAIKIADLAIGDSDGGSNVLSLTGADKDLFVILDGDLYLKAGAKLDFESNPVLAATVRLDDASVGGDPDDSVNVSVAITDVAEIITGNSKPDLLIGNAWAETINGKGGNDTIKGGGGDDIIRGGAGADRTSGGAGEDVFVFKPGDLPAPSFLTQLFDGLNGTYDLITDFTPGKDRIDLSALDANSKKSGNQAFRFEGEGDFGGARGELIYEFYGSKPSARHTIIKGDTNGDGDFDFRIVLKGHHHLDGDDFIL